MQKVNNKILMVNVREGVYLLKPEEIVCLEASSNYTRLHLCNNKMIFSAQTIKKYENCLPETDFIRIHSSFIVNKSHITQISRAKKVCLSNNLEITVAKRRWKYLMQKINGYCNANSLAMAVG
jgi:two-component system LytT family response regulator